MSLLTHSKFYYGHTITADNQNLDFDEGSGELTAVLEIGSYTLTEFVAELQRALRAVQVSRVFTVSVNRSTRVITISATGGNFSLLAATGSHIGTGVFTLAGFSAVDLSGAATYAGDGASGSEYATQFIAQSHIASEDFQSATDATVHKSASGRVEVVRFGVEKFVQINLRFITSRALGAASPIRENLTGVEDARLLMQYLTTKARVEWIEDEDTPGTFESVILESTEENKDGIAYRLKEQYGQGLPGFFETGILKFRVVD